MVNGEHGYITIGGKRLKTAAASRLAKRMEDSAFLRAWYQQPPPPCEKGCKYLEKCKAEELACAEFVDYVVPDMKPVRVEEYKQIPSREIYLWIYSKKERDGMVPLVRLRNLKEDA